MGDVSGERGKIMGMESERGFQLINTQLPQAELHNYVLTIYSITSGTVLHPESLIYYEKMPKELEQKVIQNRIANEDE